MVQEIIAGFESGLKIVDRVFNKIYKVRDEATQWAIKKYCPKRITPNVLSGIRIIGGLVMTYLLANSKSTLTVQIIFLFLIITDALDGSVARAFNLETEFGGFLDRVADKILICPVVATTLWKIDKTLVCLICGGEIISAILAVYALKKSITAKANIWGKYKMSCQSVGIAFIIFSQITWGSKVLWISIGFWFASIAGYTRRNQN